MSCGIRRETDHHRYSSYKGVVGETFENVLGRDFAADGPWQKLGTDVTEFKCSFGSKAYLARPTIAAAAIVAWSITESPNLAQQEEMLDMLLPKLPRGAKPVMGATWAGSTSTRATAKGFARPGWCKACRGRATAWTTRARRACSAISKTSSSRLDDFGSFKEGSWTYHRPLEHEAQAEEGKD